jgi:hypothetical protein
MRRIVIPTLMLMIGCATGAVMREIVVPARAQGQSGPNYEYEVVRLNNTFDGNTDVEAKRAAMQYGAQGWRLVAASQEGGLRTLYFERSKAQ